MRESQWAPVKSQLLAISGWSALKLDSNSRCGEGPMKGTARFMTYVKIECTTEWISGPRMNFMADTVFLRSKDDDRTLRNWERSVKWFYFFRICFVTDIILYTVELIVRHHLCLKRWFSSLGSKSFELIAFEQMHDVYRYWEEKRSWNLGDEDSNMHSECVASIKTMDDEWDVALWTGKLELNPEAKQWLVSMSRHSSEVRCSVSHNGYNPSAGFRSFWGCCFSSCHSLIDDGATIVLQRERLPKVEVEIFMRGKRHHPKTPRVCLIDERNCRIVIDHFEFDILELETCMRIA